MTEGLIAVGHLTDGTGRAGDTGAAADRALAGSGQALTAETRDPGRREHGPRKDTRMRTATVLVVDDLEGVRVLVGEVLGGHGYAVLTAAGVAEADALRQHLGEEGLDLVIADLRLTHRPHAREGYDLVRRWQAATPQLPCILIGGDLRPEELPDLPRRGVWCLPKPFGTAALLAAVADALAGKPAAHTVADVGPLLLARPSL